LPIVSSSLLVAANRGPVSYVRDRDGSLVARRGGGGMVSGLVSALAGTDAVWVCAALSDDDREASRQTARGVITDGVPVGVRMLDIDETVFQHAYNDIANSTLWFLNHLLYSTPTQPVFDAAWRQQWAGYVAYNEAFAAALDELAAPDAKIVVQDYHLFLVPGMLRARRPDLAIAHFTHTPWAPPEYFGLLPDDVARAILAGVLGADHAGFLCRRWADAFSACATSVLGGTGDTDIAVHGLGVDGADLLAVSRTRAVEEKVAWLRQEIGDRRMIVRVDRTELSKNNLRGLEAYAELLASHPEWRGQVVHVVFAYPSRQDLAEYRDYTAAVHALAARINADWATDDWEPVLLRGDDDFPRSLAAMRIADVLVVNPIRDGMNLVAKEAPVISDDGVVLLLSREAGAADELGDAALLLNPYDVSQTAALLHEALSMDPAERRARTDALVKAATALPPSRWFADQLAALGGVRRGAARRG
jgi:trehalose 6-phosphate synthase